jgi:hypothetical protein
VECQEPVQGRLIENCSKGVREYKLDLVGVQEGGQMGEGGH